MRTITSVILALIAYFQFIESIGCSTTPTISKTSTTDAIDSLVNRFLVELKIPGIAVGIVANGQPFMAKGYGLRNTTDLRSNVTASTLFSIGSCTKAFTTYILHTLVNVDGVLGWNDLVTKHLPEFRMSNADTTSRINVRDLVTHVSGLPRHDGAWVYGNFTIQEWLTRIPYLQTNYGLREAYQYNNIMFCVAGLLIERVTNKRWEEVVHERILQPLNMSRTCSGGLEEALRRKLDDLSAPHRISPDSKEAVIIPWLNSSPSGPAGGILSSADDMTKWMRLQLRLSGPSKEMHVPQSAVPSDPTTGVQMAYGLGWGLAYHRGRYTVSHSGDMDGFLSRLILFQEEKLGVVVLANSDDGVVTEPIMELGLRIADIVLNQSAASNTTTEPGNVEWVLKMKEEKLRAEKAIDSKIKTYALEADRRVVERPEQYVGRYENGGYGVVQVFVNDNRLFATLNNVVYTLRAKEIFDSFVAISPFPRESRWAFRFVRDYSGDVLGIMFDLEPTEGIRPIYFIREIPKDLYDPKYLSKFVGSFKQEITGAKINVTLNEGKRFLIASRGSQYAGQLKPYKRNWFSLERSLYDFYDFVGRRSLFEFVVNNETMRELREHEGEDTEIYGSVKNI